MARPKKNNAAYFSHDADMRNDIKVKALRNKFGNNGYCVWCMLLEVLTESDNFECKFDELSKELIAADFGIDSGQLEEIVWYCVILKLLVIEDGKIYCENHKSRFRPLIEKRIRDRQRISESIAKKVEQTIVYDFEAIEVSGIKDYLNSPEQQIWFEQFCMNNQTSRDELNLEIDKFVVWLQDGGITSKGKKDLKEHFRNWFKNKKYGQRANKQGGSANKNSASFKGLATERKIESAI